MELGNFVALPTLVCHLLGRQLREPAQPYLFLSGLVQLSPSGRSLSALQHILENYARYFAQAYQWLATACTSMRTIDRILQRWRIAKTRPYVASGARVLDIGCADGALFRQLKSRIGEGVGIDPYLDRSVDMDHCRLIAGWFPKDLPDPRQFDVITMLAILEHIPAKDHPQLAADCARFLKPGGYLVITVPSPIVDRLLSLLNFMRLIDGMSLEEHYGFDASKTPSIFSVGGLMLVKAEKFQLGLNNLFVFTRIEEPQRG